MSAASRSCDHSSGDNMLIIRIGKPECAFESLPAFDLRVRELAPHRSNESRCAPGSLGCVYAALHELCFLMKLELVKDHRAPSRSICALDREREEKVALQARPQHAGVEGRREYVAVLSGRGATAGPPASRRLPSSPL